jgi:hypothetical protein
MTTDFQAFPKIPRLYKDIVITEKLDGTNAQILITRESIETIPIAVQHGGEGVNLQVYVGSRNRWIRPGDDNFGFALWVAENVVELVAILGEGRHFGEWWGNGIQRGYGLPKGERRLSLFNVSVWDWLENAEARAARNVPAALHVVPTLYRGPFDGNAVVREAISLQVTGSRASPFMDPEGLMVYHEAAKQYFKVPFDTEHKGTV